MNILYFFFGYILISTIVIIFLYKRGHNQEKRRLIEESIDLTEKNEEQPIQPEIKEEKEEESKINFDEITSPDKDKPFAKISSPSAIETAEFEKIAGPTVGSIQEEKPKRKYTKKQKS